MVINKFKSDDIDLGDGVYFESVYSPEHQLLQPNFGVFWLAIKKEELYVKLSLLGYDNCYYNCPYTDITSIQKVF